MTATYLAALVALAGGSAAHAAVNPYDSLSEYAALTGPGEIITGPDGNIWYSASSGEIVKVDPSSGSALNSYPLPSPCGPAGITIGPDQNLWLACSASDQLLRVTTAGVMTTFPLTARAGGDAPRFLTSGTDGFLWFTESAANDIAKMNVNTGTVTEYPVPTPTADPEGIAVGYDGYIWFAEAAANKLASIFPPAGVIHEYAVPTPNAHPFAMAAGSDGAVYFTESSANQIGRLQLYTSGQMTEFVIPTANSGPRSINVGPDGNVWFAESMGDKIGSMTPAGTIQDVAVPTAAAQPLGVAAGTDGNLWFTESAGGKIGRVGARHNVLVLDKTALGFGKVIIGTTSPSQRVTLTNKGPDPIQFISASVSRLAGAFTMAANTCNAAVPVGSTCSVDVVFTSRAGQSASNFGTLRIDTWSGASGMPDLQTLFVGLNAEEIYGVCSSVTAVSDLSPPQIVGQVVTFTATAYGCPDPNPLFQFRVAGLIVQSYSATSTFAWDTRSYRPASYEITVEVRDANSSTFADAETRIEYGVLPPPVCTSAVISSGVASPQPSGTVVNFTVTSSGCPAPLYQWWIRDRSGSWTIAPGFDFAHSSATFAWNTAGLGAGTYHVGVWAKQTGSSVGYDAYAITTYTVTVTPCTAVNLTTSSAPPQAVGSTITLSASAAGCSNPQYRFYVRDLSGVWTVVQDFGVSASYAWSPGSTVSTNSAGTYLLGVWARQPGSDNAYDAFGIVTFALTSASTCTVSVTAAPISPQPQTASAVWTATTQNCTLPGLQYEFWVSPPGGGWAIVKTYGFANAYGWTGSNPGTYQVGVWILQAGSAAPFDSFALTTFTVTPASTPQTCQSVNITASPTSPTKIPSVVTFTASAVTGCPTPQFRWWIGDQLGNWFLEQDYTVPGNTFTWNASCNSPSCTGLIWQVGAWARQAGSGASYEAYGLVTYTLFPADRCSWVSISSNVKPPATTGSTVTFTATALGCSSPEFKFSVGGGFGVPVSQAYSTTNTFVWTQRLPGNYVVQVWARATGDIYDEAFNQISPFRLDFSAGPCSQLAIWPSTGTTPTNTSASQPPQPGGVKITWETGVAGCGAAEYEFAVSGPLGFLGPSQAWSTTPTFVLDTAGLPRGTYQVGVSTRQQGWLACPTCVDTFDVRAFSSFEVT